MKEIKPSAMIALVAIVAAAAVGVVGIMPALLQQAQAGACNSFAITGPEQCSSGNSFAHNNAATFNYHLKP
jgi:hypothetical protein